MEKIGLILLVLWLVLSGFKTCINSLGILTSPLVLGLLQLAAGVCMLIGLWPILRL